MTRAHALAKLKETRELSTDLLEPLGISFEVWLTAVSRNYTPDTWERVIDKILERG